MKNIIISSLFCCLIWGCENNAIIEKHDHDHGHGHDHENGHNDTENSQVELSEKQLEIVDLSYGTFTSMNLSSVVKCNGKLELPPQNKASVSSIIAGKIKSISVTEGDVVKKGQILALIEHPDIISYQENYLDVYNNLSVLKNEFERKKDLLKDSIASVKSYEEAESDYSSALAKLATLRAKLNMMGISESQVIDGKITSSISVKSPLNGYVQLIEINIGMYVEPQTEMFEIVDNDHIHIDLQVYEQDLNKVSIGQSVLFSLSSDPGSDFTATIFAIGKAFEESTKAVRVHAEITNHKTNLLPGMFVNALIQTNPKETKALPDEAIISEGLNEYIFVKSDEDHGSHTLFLKIPVTTGNKEMGYTEIVSHGEFPSSFNIVVKGAFYLDAEMKKGENGHIH